MSATVNTSRVTTTTPPTRMVSVPPRKWAWSERHAGYTSLVENEVHPSTFVAANEVIVSSKMASTHRL